MKKIIIISIGLLIIFLSSCDDNAQQNIIQYRADGASDQYELSWLDAAGEKKSAVIDPTSAKEIWSVSFEAEEGQIYFLSGRYYNPENKLNISVLLNGKNLKTATSVYDTTRYIIVSGTVPYEN